MRALPYIAVALLSLAACKRKHEPQPRTQTGSGSGSAQPATGSKAAISRADFNRFAVRLNLPVYWIVDGNGNGALDPDEVAPLLFYPTVGHWVDHGAFTPELEKVYADIVAASKAPPPDASTEDGKRRGLVLQDLDAGRATLIFNDLSSMTDEDKDLVRRMLELAAMIDDLFEVTNGAAALVSKLPPDVESHSLFRRNRGPECRGPVTSKDPACSAIPGSPKPVFDLYPAEVQAKPGFCKELAARKNGAALMGHFNVVRGSGDALEAVPYSVAYKDRMTAISNKLADAAKAIKDPKEAALVAYLEAASKSFLTNDWVPADEAWAKMSVDNSKWYVRIGPDETYWEPCAEKGAFHLGFAKVNQGSKTWQQKLVPIQQEMEAAVAAKAGPPYKARTVTFHLPDFIDVIANAGEDRTALLTTLGQSLPNWGPVVDRGAGRTWAALNVSNDADTDAARKNQTASLFDTETTAIELSDDADLLGTILHEATHNLGPAHDYKVGGKDDSASFGGPVAQMLEELKAQTGAYFLVEMLRTKGLITDALARQVYYYAIVWSCGHISQGMYSVDGARKSYGQLAAIQLGYFLDKGALTWDANKLAANGTDKGAFTVHLDKMPAVAGEMMKDIGGIKARGDKAAADKLLARYVDSDTVVPHKLITDRMLREPRYSHVYSVRL
jgi:hypothetical protein